MQIIDYSSETPGMTGSLASGKFVHIAGPDGEYLLLSPVTSTKYHAQIISRFCRERSDVSFVMPPSGESGQFAVKGWSVFGGGHFRFNRKERILRLYGMSQAYGMVDFEQLGPKVVQVHGWQDVTVVVGPPLS